MTLGKTHKRLISILFGIAAMLLFCVNALLVFVITGPRSLNSVTPYIESALAPPGSPYKVRVESSMLIWDGWRHPIAIHAKNVEVVDSKGVDIARFPEVGVSMYVYKLLMGQIDVKSLEVLHPTALLIQGDDGGISFGFTQADNAADNSISTAFTLLTDDAGTNPVTHLQSLIIRHASISIKRGHEGVFLQSPDASLEITRSNGVAKGTLSMPLQFGVGSGELDADFSLNRDNKTVTAEVVYTDIPSTILQQLFPAQQWMQSAQMPTSGWAHMISDFDAHISALDFLLEAGPGTFEYPSQFEKPLQVQRLHAEGSLTDKLSTLVVKKGILTLNKLYTIQFSGSAHKQGDDYGVDGTAEVSNVPVDNVHLYWPLGLSPHTRKWVAAHITDGKIIKAGIKGHFKPGDFKLKDTPKDDIDASIEVRGATVKYMAKHPAVTDINGVVKFTGDSMDARITHAKYMSDTVANSASVRFPDLNASDVRLFLDMDLTAGAKDVVEFLSLPDLDKAKTVNLTHAITGSVSGNAKFDFIAFSDRDENDRSSVGHINYDITGDLHNVSQHDFMGSRDIADANMKIGVSNKGIKADGRARVNDVPMAINLTTTFATGHETTYTVKTDMPVARLGDFGLPMLSFAKGAMGVNATFVASDSVDKADATLDLQQTAIAMPEHGFNKKAGEAATLKLSTEHLSSGNTLIKSFLLKGKDLYASGKGEFSKSSHEFSSLTLDTLRFGRTDLIMLDYALLSNGGIKLIAKGRTFDASPYVMKSGGSSGIKQAYDVDIKTDSLILGDGRSLRAVDIKADCGVQCHGVNISVKLPDNTPFTYLLGGGKLTAACDNTGELLRTLGVFDGIQGGKMTITGDVVDGKINGTLIMKDYTLNHAPVLTKIFTIASLTGILDTLTGNGIAFTKMTAPFAYQHNIIVLKEAKAYGAAIGITADGVINIGGAKLDLNGTLVPSYTMNSLIGNIPLIGSVLMGGKGKGIIAINYSVSGDMKDPSISVNPLSVLTPGFLRNVFDIFDKPPPDIDKIVADQKKADDAQKKAVPAATTVVPAATPSSSPAPASSNAAPAAATSVVVPAAPDSATPTPAVTPATDSKPAATLPAKPKNSSDPNL